MDILQDKKKEPRIYSSPNDIGGGLNDLVSKYLTPKEEGAAIAQSAPETKNQAKEQITNTANQFASGKIKGISDKYVADTASALEKIGEDRDAYMKASDDLYTKAQTSKGLSKKEAVGLALLTLIPTALGGVLGGKRGVAIGGTVGVGAGSNAYNQLQKEKEAERDATLKQADRKASQAEGADKIIQASSLDMPEKQAGFGVRGVELDEQMAREKLETETADRKLDQRISDASLKDEMKTFVPGVGKFQTSADATEFKKTAPDALNVLQIVNDLKNEVKTIGSGGKLNLADRAKIENKILGLVGRLRMPITGPGVMTESERAMIREMVGDPKKILTLDSVEIAKLEALSEIAQGSLNNAARAWGADTEYTPSNERLQRVNQSTGRIVPQSTKQSSVKQGGLSADEEAELQELEKEFGGR